MAVSKSKSKSKTARPAPAPPRKSRARGSSPEPARPSARRAPTAAEVPVTRAMLGEVRTELLERIDQAKDELRAEIHGVRAELHHLKAEVHELRAEIHEVKAELHEVKAGLHGVQAEVARIGLLIEEQNARNKVVLDALMAIIDRQSRIEQRMDKVEETVRGLAAARPAG